MKDPMVRLLTVLLLFLTLGMLVKPHEYTVGFIVHADEDISLMDEAGQLADCRVKQISLKQVSDRYDLVIELRHDQNLPMIMGDPALFADAQYCSFSEENSEGISVMSCGSEVTGNSWSVLNQNKVPALVLEMNSGSAEQVSEVIRRIRNE